MAAPASKGVIVPTPKEIIVPTLKGVIMPSPKEVIVSAPKGVIVPTPKVISSLYIRHILTLNKIL